MPNNTRGTSFLSNLIIALISAALGFGTAWYFDIGTTRQSNRLFNETQRQTAELVEHTRVLSNGFAGLADVIENEGNINQNISVIVNNLQNNINSIRTVSSSLAIKYGVDATKVQPPNTTPILINQDNVRPQEVVIPVGSYEAKYIDSENAIALKEDTTNGRMIYANFNGNWKCYVGDSRTFRNEKKKWCKATYMGIRNNYYIFSISCQDK